MILSIFLRAVPFCPRRMAKRIKGIKVITVNNSSEGEKAAYDLLLKTLNKDSALFLSGGKTPVNLYKKLAQNNKVSIGAVGLVDERFGEAFHKGSNEKMIKNTGMLDFLERENIPFYSILDSGSALESGLVASGIKRTSSSHLEGGNSVGTGSDIESLSLSYERRVKDLFRKYKKRAAVLGIGEDGHIAGLPTGQTQKSKLKSQNYAESIRNFPGEFRERITLTFKALAQMDLLLVLVFGANKRKALSKVFEKETPEEIPARFLTRRDIAEKTILITDQKV
ncbi:MAG: 6-phosphogluconolactonase [Patescibacteria group bacterium]|nr:6-phosphogluconolactonase [Patescibacteria group bacterium]